ncbi:uncharacterized protein LOC122513133 [Leptopilina heterotoma]|uniref:uncharacterized protein LOC122513133 n=1 Tax=Leptopilina heterotoma TaxID=63436 RepID=UPI001CA9B392|nr:uncharacterized protein LOC122513133 [Leptopilina heterotoma]
MVIISINAGTELFPANCSKNSNLEVTEDTQTTPMLAENIMDDMELVQNENELEENIEDNIVLELVFDSKGYLFEEEPNFVRRLQNFCLFYVQYHRTNYGRNSIINRLCRESNLYCDSLDFFGVI